MNSWQPPSQAKFWLWLDSFLRSLPSRLYKIKFGKQISKYIKESYKYNSLNTKQLQIEKLQQKT